MSAYILAAIAIGAALLIITGTATGTAAILCGVCAAAAAVTAGLRLTQRRTGTGGQR